ncbi:MAG: hypothetical protein R2822_24035 [Spirosomataceae bacterium]
MVGQTIINSNTETVTSKDSVQVGEATINGKKVPVKNLVTAKLNRTRKSVLSSGLLDMQIMDFRTKSVVSQEKFRGDYNWFCEWEVSMAMSVRSQPTKKESAIAAKSIRRHHNSYSLNLANPSTIG